MPARLALLLLLACSSAWAVPPPQEPPAPLVTWLERELPAVEELYRELHRNPELSFQEEQTSAHMAGILSQAGFDMTRAVGGHGVVGVLRNGPGAVLLVRTDMDALPIVEQTGLPYASTVAARDDAGREVGVMHACGHDLHMGVWAGAARFLSAHRELWSGTLVFIAQPAEERGAGARMMLEDGLLERFPRPDYCLSLHADPFAPAGVIRYTSGFAFANVDTVDIRVRGQGGHGSAPHTTHDPVVLAARIVVALQTLVSRELDPQQPGVVTVGSIHGGTKHNIIPDEVQLQLTVRSYGEESRSLLLDGIARAARFEALAAGFPLALLPETTVAEEEHTPAAFNDPELVARVNAAVQRAIGADNVQERAPTMGGEDFGRYAMAAGCPGYMFWLGSIEPDLWRAAQEPDGPELPGTHSALFAPAPGAALHTGITAISAGVLELLPAAHGWPSNGRGGD